MSTSIKAQYGVLVPTLVILNSFISSSAWASDGAEFGMAATVPLSTLARENEDLVIAANQIVEIDSSVNIGKLTIKGQLVCPQAGEFLLRTTGISVDGKKASFVCGSVDHPFRGKLNLALKPGRFEKIHSSVASDRNVQVMNGAKLKWFGETRNSRWLKLAANVRPGAIQIQVSEAVEWRAGDRLAIGPSSYSSQEAEEAVVQSVSSDGRWVTLAEPLRFSHWGELQTFEGRKSWVIDERSEVANLTRNIVVYSEGDPAQMDHRGAHIMVMKGASAQLDAVELVYMGRLSEMARYPFHWHLVGNAQGQFIRNSSIHHSFQRCVTIHGTNKAEVINNVCFNHFGHGFFLENGNEVDNKIIGNLGILTRRPPEGRQLLQSDIDVSSIDRFPGPATFWISNPKNIVTGNVASGSEGTGIWNSFSDGLYCTSTSCEKPSGQQQANVFPIKEKTTQFSDNSAHSCLVGITWDGAPDGALTRNNNNSKDRFLVNVHYKPKAVPTFSNLSFSKNSQAAVYFRGNTSVFDGAVLADNKVGLFFAFNTVVQNSLIVAKSANDQNADEQYATEFTGMRIYDGPFDLRSTDFFNFSKEDWVQGQRIIPSPFSMIGGFGRYINVAQSLAFYPAPPRRLVNFWPENGFPWADSNSSPGLRDLDGSLTGWADSILVPDHPFNRDSSCTSLPEGSTMTCRYQKGVVTLVSKRDSGRDLFMPFIVRRSDGAQTYSSFDRSTPDDLQLLRDRGYTHHFKFGVIIGDEFSYDVIFRKDWKLPGGDHAFEIIFRPEFKGAVSPVIAFQDLGSGCRIVSSNGNEWIRANSIEHLKSLRANSYYTQGSTLLVRLVGTEPIPMISTPGSEFMKSAQNKPAYVQCGG
jgi:cell migration-inducing and hyaluronan-binding protein